MVLVKMSALEEFNIIQGVYSFLYAEEKNSEIIDYLSEQDLYTSADIIFFEDIFNNT